MDIVTLAMAKKYSDRKGGYVENAIVMPRQELELVYSEDEGAFCAVFNPAPFVPVVGTDYIVKWDGVEYKRTCVGDGIFSAFGNVGAMRGESTGEPFLVLYMDGTLNVLSVDATEQVTVTVEIIAETIVTIDPKYLPGVCLPVVELNIDALMGEEVAFTDAENAALTACIGMPCILKFVNSTVSTSWVMEYSGGGNEHIFARGDMTLYTNNGGETWTVINA